MIRDSSVRDRPARHARRALSPVHITSLRHSGSSRKRIALVPRQPHGSILYMTVVVGTCCCLWNAVAPSVHPLRPAPVHLSHAHPVSPVVLCGTAHLLARTVRTTVTGASEQDRQGGAEPSPTRIPHPGYLEPAAVDERRRDLRLIRD